MCAGRHERVSRGVSEDIQVVNYVFQVEFERQGLRKLDDTTLSSIGGILCFFQFLFVYV